MIADGFLLADSVFYDGLERLDDENSLFGATRREAPPGWTRRTRGVWVGLQPVDTVLPRQGWKIHLSVRPVEAERVIDEVWRYCMERRLAFKFLRSRDAQMVTNFKYADRSASGKLVAIYPDNEQLLRDALADLDAALGGTPGPYVLSDVRWKAGPLYVRYGAFLDDWADDPHTGELELCIRRPDGTPEPDRRLPVFRVPDWVQVPGFIRPAIARLGGGPRDFPYEILEALHFSNAGGVYLAKDPPSDRRVVLKEARPHAGLDPSGADAVARLRRERQILKRLAGSGIAPELLGEFIAWEHHFLVEEYVAGTTLEAELPRRYPYLHPDPSPQVLREYTEWALAVLHDVEVAISRMHERGLVFGDLHPGNIQLRHDGGVALLDLELAAAVEDEFVVPLGAPGFRAPAITSGSDVDRYALGCLRLHLFMPVTTLMYWDSRTGARDVCRRLLAQARSRFPDLPRGYAGETLRLIGETAAQGHPDRPVPRRRDDRPVEVSASPEALIDALTLAITRSATPDRSDRLFPGAVEQFSSGGLGLAYGAAGVLYALNTARPRECAEQYVEWLVQTARRTDFVRPGLYDGASGVAFALDRVGRAESGMDLAIRWLASGTALRRTDLFSGLPGIGLSALHWATRTGERRFLDAAAAIGRRLETLVRDHGTGVDLPPPSVGLMRGWSGLALFLVRLYESVGDESLLDAARLGLNEDLKRCRVADAGAMHVDDGFRLLLYLSSGAIGVGAALAAYLGHRESPRFRDTLASIRRTCDIDFCLFPGLFDGRAGVIAGISLMDAPGPRRERRVARQLDQLQWHLVDHDGGVGVPGEGLVRLSMDLATGAAGVLLATHAARTGGEEVLPFLRTADVALDSAQLAEAC